MSRRVLRHSATWSRGGSPSTSRRWSRRLDTSKELAARRALVAPRNSRACRTSAHACGRRAGDQDRCGAARSRGTGVDRASRTAAGPADAGVTHRANAGCAARTTSSIAGSCARVSRANACAGWSRGGGPRPCRLADVPRPQPLRQRGRVTRCARSRDALHHSTRRCLGFRSSSTGWAIDPSALRTALTEPLERVRPADHRSPRTASPTIMMSCGPSICARTSSRSPTQSMQGSTCAATCTGRPGTTSSGPRATRNDSACSPSIARRLNESREAECGAVCGDLPNAIHTRRRNRLRDRERDRLRRFPISRARLARRRSNSRWRPLLLPRHEICSSNRAHQGRKTKQQPVVDERDQSLPRDAIETVCGTPISVSNAEYTRP